MTKLRNIQTIDASTPARAERRPARQNHASPAADSMAMKVRYLEARAESLRLSFGG
ncbi:hypothetical protein [Ornithinimicrobium ciconiae]|uniref:hypothetical protein n=1 Tax=Ornithinimicrobium ciconiae TaxID=2594265 RepID=UPI0013FD0D44|nr:hypothetical protein [Ornithinimicrobium ciconiae]